MGNVKEVIQLGNPILRKRAKPVKDIEDIKIQQVIDDMLSSLEKQAGVGLAAPQIGESYRIFLVDLNEDDKSPKEPPMVVINPKIVQKSKSKEIDWEGCLSIPGLRGKVARSRKIVIEYFDRDGSQYSIEAEDFVARIFQHEFDHLEGKVFIDRVSSTKEIITEQEYIKLFED